MKATLIHRYDGTVKLVYGGDLMREEMDFLNSDDAMKFADHFDIEIGWFTARVRIFWATSSPRTSSSATIREGLRRRYAPQDKLKSERKVET